MLLLLLLFSSLASLRCSSSRDGQSAGKQGKVEIFSTVWTWQSKGPPTRAEQGPHAKSNIDPIKLNELARAGRAHQAAGSTWRPDSARIGPSADSDPSGGSELELGDRYTKGRRRRNLLL